VQNDCRAGQDTDGNITWRTRIACRIPRDTKTHSHNTRYLFAFPPNGGCTNAPERYVVRTVPVMLHVHHHHHHHHHHQIFLLLAEHRASMKSFQALRSAAIPLTSFHDLLVLLISSSIVLRHVLFGLPLLLYR